MYLQNGIQMQQLEGLLSSPAISANAVSNFATRANAVTKGVDVGFSLVDITGVKSVTLRRNYLNDLKTATVIQTWDALVSAYTWSDTDAALQTSASAYYWLTLSPTGTTGKAVDIGPQRIVLNPQLTPPVEATSISASHGAAINGAVLVTVNVNGIPDTGSIKIYVTGYQGNANPVAVAQQTSSPLQFTLLATGETVTLTAIGVSAGGAEAATGPTTTLVLNGTATVPAQPQNVTIAQIPAGNQITFPASLDNVTSYKIYRANRGDPFSSATLLHTITGSNVGTIQYLDTGGFSGDYEYFVVAVNAAGSSLPSSPASVNFIAASSVLYIDGQPVQALQPAAPAADVTAQQPIAYTGFGSNLIPNGTFILANIKGWFSPDNVASYNASAGGLLLATSGNGVVSPTFNVTPGQKYRLSFTGRNTQVGTQSVTHRIAGSPTYYPNTDPGLAGNIYYDFLSGGTLVSTLTTYDYDWICPAGIYFASLAMYEAGAAQLVYTNVSAQDYVAAKEWGADVTGSNTSANTSAIGTLPAADVTNTINPGGGVDFLNPGNTNQGDLSKINQANTINIVAGAVNASVVYSSTVLVNIPINTKTIIAQNTIVTNGGYVKIRAMAEIFGNSATAYANPQIIIYKGSATGTQIAFYGNVFVPLSGTGSGSVIAIEAVDDTPSTSQQYTVTAYASGVAMQLDSISFVIENAKV